MGFGERLQLSYLLEEYAKKGMLADDEFVYRAIEIILKARKLKDYVQDIAINNKEYGNSDAYFDYFNGIIQVKNQYVGDAKISYNAHLLQVILHEIEHIEQYRICERKNRDLKSQLLTESLLPNLFRRELAEAIDTGVKPEEYIGLGAKVGYMALREDAIKKIYGCIPSERMAEIDSHKKMIGILRKIKKPYYQDSLDTMENNLMKRKLMGYHRIDEIIMAPTYSLFFLIDSLSPNPNSLNVVIAELDKLSGSLGLEDRLYYGLAITEDEYKEGLLSCVK